MVLTTLIDLTGSTGWVLLLVPYMTLAVVVVGVIAGRDRTGSREGAAAADVMRVPLPLPLPGTDAVRRSSGAPATSTAEAVAESPVRTGVAGPAPVSGDTSRTIPSPRPGPWHERVPAGDAAKDGHRRAATPRTESRRDIESRLAEAEERFDDAVVARLSLAMAREILSGAETGGDAKAYLRRAIIIAARLDDKDTHASARLELGDVLAAEGDMTTACEHWQIARQIYWDGDERAKLADVDARMVANGCPTDWVLNDF